LTVIEHRFLFVLTEQELYENEKKIYHNIIQCIMSEIFSVLINIFR